MKRFYLFSGLRKKAEACSSGKAAKERLEMVLLSEKMHSSPDMMIQMKKEIRDVVSKYLNADYSEMNIQIELTNDVKQGAEHVKTIQIKRL